MNKKKFLIFRSFSSAIVTFDLLTGRVKNESKTNTVRDQPRQKINNSGTHKTGTQKFARNNCDSHVRSECVLPRGEKLWSL